MYYGLCVEVMEKTFGSTSGFPQMHVLDSTDPAQVKAIEKQVDLGKTLFIVSSKSGSTLEPNIFKQYFFERVAQTVGAGKAGNHFFAITDPGSKMEQVAKSDSFNKIFFKKGRHLRVWGRDVRNRMDWTQSPFFLGALFFGTVKYLGFHLDLGWTGSGIMQ